MKGEKPTGWHISLRQEQRTEAVVNPCILHFRAWTAVHHLQSNENMHHISYRQTPGTAHNEKKGWGLKQNPVEHHTRVQFSQKKNPPDGQKSSYLTNKRNHFKAVPLMPALFSKCDRIQWSPVPKAKRKWTTTAHSSGSTGKIRSLKMFSSTVSVLWWSLKPEWKCSYMLTQKKNLQLH